MPCGVMQNCTVVVSALKCFRFGSILDFHYICQLVHARAYIYLYICMYTHILCFLRYMCVVNIEESTTQSSTCDCVVEGTKGHDQKNVQQWCVCWMKEDRPQKQMKQQSIREEIPMPHGIRHHRGHRKPTPAMAATVCLLCVDMCVCICLHPCVYVPMCCFLGWVPVRVCASVDERTHIDP